MSARTAVRPGRRLVRWKRTYRRILCAKRDALPPRRAKALLWLERHSLEPMAQMELLPPHVFEDIAPGTITWRGRRGLLTVRSGPVGGQLAVVARTPGGPLELAALGEPIGTPMRWMSPTTDGCRLWAVHTPHIGGVLHRYSDAGDRLLGRVIARGVSKHAIGDRELDVSGWVGSRWIGPTQDRHRLLIIDAAVEAEVKAPSAVTLPRAVNALISWRRGPDDGVAAPLADGSVWWVAVTAGACIGLRFDGVFSADNVDGLFLAGAEELELTGSNGHRLELGIDASRRGS